ncbi:MAG: carboxy-S-adenosyl-L-methionine synthase CmoA [Acidiferrobacterales bacterium]|nr:carboxy-S-adenosyl-L-methionine synthase CmoA [Acidiferrobacterales bacterium]
MKKDSIFAEPKQHIVDFAFDDAVADVFPDMIRRSVPGYDTLITSIAVIAERYSQPDSRVYDLGCSHGAATLATYSRLKNTNVEFFAVDSSESMMRHCKEQFSHHISGTEVVCLQEDIWETEIEKASVVIMNLTMQFIAPDRRQALVDKIYNGLLPGGALILTEKIHYSEPSQDDLLVSLYHHFKSANGYSELEISQKRTALENVMKLNSIDQHHSRLRSAGFSQVSQWFQCFNFVSLLAVR